MLGALGCRMVTRLFDTGNHRGEIEPLTGLLSREAFYERVATLIGARTRDDDRYLAVVVVSLDSFSLLTGMTGAAGGNRARAAIGQRLRETVRDDTIVAHVGEAEFRVAELSTSPHPSPNRTNPCHHRHGTLPVDGQHRVVTTALHPLVARPPHDVLDEILTIATAAMYETRTAGGNLVHHEESPSLTVLDDPEADGVAEDRFAS